MTMVARAAPIPAIRPVGLEMLDLTLARVATVMVVVAHDAFPEVVMFNGDPFIRDTTISPLAYRRVRPFYALGA